MEPNRAGDYLLFRAGREDLLMRVARVHAMMPIHELIELENPALGVIGFVVCGGRNCPVIDLAARLGISAALPGRPPWLIVAEIDSPDGPRRFGFVAHRISEIVKLRERDFHADSARVNGRLRRLFDPAEILRDDAMWADWRSAIFSL